MEAAAECGLPSTPLFEWSLAGCRLATEYDIVVTTYATLTADFQGRNSMAGNKGAGGKVEKQPIPVGVVP